MGDAGGFLRHSSGRSGAFVLAQRCWGGGLWTARSLFMMGPRDRGRKRLSRVELLPEPGSESRFRITVQNPAGARGSGLVGRDLLAPRPSGWSTGFLS